VQSDATQKELRNGAQTQSRAARKPQPINLSDRLVFSPAEFAALNGKSATWGYRRIYHGDVKVISTAGRILIPRTEVDTFLARADQYNPKAKARQAEGGE
jgi:hypothetical protein